MFIEPTQKDIDRARIVEPAWYRVRIEEKETSISKKGTTTNIRLQGVILYNADTGDKKFEGTPTPFFWFFNTGAIGQIFPVLQACDPSLEIVAGQRIDLEPLTGSELEMFIGNGTYNNAPCNVVTNQYRPVKEKRAH